MHAYFGDLACFIVLYFVRLMRARTLSMNLLAFYKVKTEN